MLKSKLQPKLDSDIIGVKTKFEADIIRFSVNRNKPISYKYFEDLLAKKHGIGPDMEFLILYIDPTNQDLLPINNDNNLERALHASKHLLRICIQRKSDTIDDTNESGIVKAKNLISSIFKGTLTRSKPPIISSPQDFRQVSSIIDVDILPSTYRRVKFLKQSNDKPLGFYIRDGESYHALPTSMGGGFQKVPAIFISKVMPGGLAASTGLLSVNDEVLEVNGIEVTGKSLDQVTDMMVANSLNLTITIKPFIQQRESTSPRRGSLSRTSQMSSKSRHSSQSAEDEEVDEVIDLTGLTTHDHKHP